MIEFIEKKFMMALDETSSQQQYSLCNLVDANGSIAREEWERTIKSGSVVRMIRLEPSERGPRGEAQHFNTRVSTADIRMLLEGIDFDPEALANFEETWSSARRLQRRTQPNPDTASGPHPAREGDNGGPDAAAVSLDPAAANDRPGDNPDPRNFLLDRFISETETYPDRLLLRSARSSSGGPTLKNPGRRPA